MALATVCMALLLDLWLALEAAWFPLLVSLLLLTLGLTLLYRHALLVAWLSHRLDHRFSPLAIRAALGGYRPFASADPTQSLSNWLLRHYLRPDRQAYAYHLLLAPEGGGKTTFMLRLFLKLQWPRHSRSRVLMLHAADADTMERLAARAHRERTILLLDGLDEDALLHSSGQVRVDEWLTATQGFQKVLISCGPEHWPGSFTPVAEGEAIRYTGEQVVQLMACFRLPALGSKPKPRLWLRRLYGLSKAEAETGRPPFRVQRIQGILNELGPSPQQRPHLAAAFWQAVALEMAERVTLGLGLTLAAPRLHDLHLIHAPNWPLLPLIRDLLWRDGLGQYQFHHRALAAFFLSQAEQIARVSLKSIPWSGLPQAQSYRQERAWLTCMEHPDHEEVFFRLPDSTALYPLTDLHATVVNRISRLYLPVSLLDQAERLLPGLPHLRGLYLRGGDRQPLPGAWLEALPHTEVVVYLTDQAAKLESVWQYQPTEAAWSGQQAHWPGRALSFEPLRLREQPPIDQPLPHPNGGSLDDRGLSDWLVKELDAWLEPSLPVEAVLPGEYRLPFTAFGLFHRLCIWPGTPGRINLQLDLAFPSTLLIDELRPLVSQLVTRMGEDDQHLRELAPDDEAQLADGFWTGRRWLWGNTDRYASPVRLTSERAGFATLEIWNLRLSPRESSQPLSRPDKP